MSREAQVKLGNPYPDITFRKDYKTFEEFKAELENTHVFKEVPAKQRNKALKDAFKFATSKANGHVSTNSKSGGKTDATEGK